MSVLAEYQKYETNFDLKRSHHHRNHHYRHLELASLGPNAPSFGVKFHVFTTLTANAFRLFILQKQGFSLHK